MKPFLPKPMSEEQNEDDELIRDLIPWYLASEKENLILLEAALAERDFAELIASLRNYLQDCCNKYKLD